MSPRGRFAYSDEELYCNDKAYFMTGRSLKWFCAVLNSRLVTWMIRKTARTTGAGLTQWQKFVVETIPVPVVPADQKRAVVEKLDRLLSFKKTNPVADTSQLEIELDRLICMSYGLTDEEITLLEWPI